MHQLQMLQVRMAWPDQSAISWNAGARIKAACFRERGMLFSTIHGMASGETKPYDLQAPLQTAKTTAAAAKGSSLLGLKAKMLNKPAK